uniref:Uncharacterized protein n=1 Tax=Anguilla anguilla TaxID=7936 RepID=A0A0E9UIX2_ANGAN
MLLSPCCDPLFPWLVCLSLDEMMECGDQRETSSPTH